MAEESVKNKSRFQSRRSIVSEGRLREMQAFGGNPIPHSDHHLMLEDFVSMSIRRQCRPLPMFKLQGQILMDLVDAENSVAEYKKKLIELEQDNASQEDIQFVQSELYKYRRLRYALRDIGDGIAWRLLESDRCALSQMAIRARKPHINKGGLEQELIELGDVINRTNEVAVLNDLTNILKKGDVTAKLADGSFEFVEVKSSNTKSSRLVRQKQDLEETISFLNDGEKKEGTELIRISILQVTPRSYLRNFERLLVRAETECLITEKIGEHLLLHLTDFLAARDEIDPSISFGERDAIIGQWQANSDMVLEFNTIDRYTHVQNFAPYSIFPIAHRLRVKLMTGALLVGTSLNASAVLRYLNRRGWAVVKGPEEFAKDFELDELTEVPFAALKKGPLTVHLPLPILGRLAHEYLSIVTLGDIFDAILKIGPTSADGIFPGLSGEALQWD